MMFLGPDCTFDRRLMGGDQIFALGEFKNSTALELSTGHLDEVRARLSSAGDSRVVKLDKASTGLKNVRDTVQCISCDIQLTLIATALTRTSTEIVVSTNKKFNDL
jgi:hypothetical protein